MSISINSATKLNAQKFEDGEKRYVITNLISLAEGLPVKEMPIEHLNIWNLYPKPKSTRDYISHIKSVLEADLNCPIILDDEGYVMDGRHRIIKSIIEEKDTIKFVRFETTPSADYIVEEKD